MGASLPWSCVTKLHGESTSFLLESGLLWVTTGMYTQVECQVSMGHFQMCSKNWLEAMFLKQLSPSGIAGRVSMFQLFYFLFYRCFGIYGLQIAYTHKQIQIWPLEIIFAAPDHVLNIHQNPTKILVHVHIVSSNIVILAPDWKPQLLHRRSPIIPVLVILPTS